MNSGATEHIINKSLILTDFKLTKDGIIKGTNKIQYAKIVIDGRGDLLLQSNDTGKKDLKLLNVISAKDVSENLFFSNRLDNTGLRARRTEELHAFR